MTEEIKILLPIIYQIGYEGEIKECKVKEGAELFGFFQKLDKFVEDFCGTEVYLEQILLSKIKENK